MSVSYIGRARTITDRRRFAALARSGFRCVYCGTDASRARLEVDHVRPVSRGGGNRDENLVAACVRCNSGKSDAVLSCDGAVNDLGARVLFMLHEVLFADGDSGCALCGTDHDAPPFDCVFAGNPNPWLRVRCDWQTSDDVSGTNFGAAATVRIVGGLDGSSLYRDDHRCPDIGPPCQRCACVISVRTVATYAVRRLSDMLVSPHAVRIVEGR